MLARRDRKEERKEVIQQRGTWVQETEESIVEEDKPTTVWREKQDEVPGCRFRIQFFFIILIQAFTNFKNGSTGQLSAVTCFMLFAGALARVFTTIQETGDNILLLTFICTTILNGIIAAQVLWYWNADKDKAKKKE
ncbi:Mannose-P-dolichol utilization defect 1 protein [Blattella germanica]|nr:Mannose-P-dolichol utilization defect 1 protein [Blattella germanica]